MIMTAGTMRWAGLLAALLLVTFRAGAADTPQLTPMLVETVSPIRALPGGDAMTHLVFEVRLSNPTPGLAVFQAFTVEDADSGAELLRYDREEIAGRLTLGGSRSSYTDTLGHAQYGLLYVDVMVPQGTTVPGHLRYRVTVDMEAVTDGFMVTAMPVAVVPFEPPVLGAPLVGDNYVAADGCCDSTRHVRATLPIDGRLRLSQRYAIDWEQVDAENRLVTGDLSVSENYVIYGKELLAVADGEVVAAVDGYEDQVPGAMPVGVSLEEADGNHIVLKIGEGLYVLYAHLKPGSVAVSTGDHVTRGDVLGLVGNTGNTLAPHLHLHVMDGPSALDANGLPYVFERFAQTATNPIGTEDFDLAEATGSPVTLDRLEPPVVHMAAMPMDQWLVDWMNAND